MLRRISIYFLIILGCLASWAGGASAQTNTEINAGIHLNLSQPGARSLGMGGAFIGLADDSTAAYTNPAGLANLSAGEISIEARSWDFTTRYTDDGEVELRNGTFDGSELIEGESTTSTSGLSFAAVTYPRGRWVFALYYHQLANYTAELETQGARAFDDFNLYFLFPARASTLLEIEGTGAAAGVRVTDRFSLGVGVVSYNFLWESTTERFRDLDDRNRGDWLNRQDVEGEDEAVSASVGFEWKLSDHVRLGGVYRAGPEFDFSTSNRLGPGAGFSGLVVDADEGVFRIPDVYGLGLSYRGASFRVLADWVRVEYSALSQETVDVFDDGGASGAAASRLVVDDADEFHLGFEYVFLNRTNPIAIRVGAWHDPDHEIRYQEPIQNSAADVADALLFRAGADETHYTAGLGFVVGDGRFEFNVAVDLSDRVDTAAASLVLRVF